MAEQSGWLPASRSTAYFLRPLGSTATTAGDTVVVGGIGVTRKILVWREGGGAPVGQRQADD